MPLFAHAIVIGGSIAGSLAARVLADQAARVTVIERDRYPADADHRAGVPQSHHVHILLVRGLELMEGLLPGFKDELIRQGGRQGSLIRQNPTYLYRNWIPLPKHDLEGMAASRPLVETVLRQMIIRQYPQIVWETEHQAVNLVVAAGRVCGVEVQEVGQTHQRRTLSADLVVDASGRDSNLPSWLEHLGYRLPPPTVVNAHVGYTTGWFEPPAGARRVDWEGLIVRSPATPTMRSAVLSMVEGNRWIITLSGCGRDYPPHDESGFLDFAKSLPTPIIAEAIQRSQLLASIRGSRKMENRHAHYERLAPALDGIIVLGDAFCALNPIYGQGMTMAAQGATLLGTWLGNTVIRPGWSRRFHRTLAGAYTLPWLMATGEDYRVSGVDAPPAPFWLRIAHRYFDAVLRVCTSDGDIWRTFLQVANMTRHPAHLIHPRILWATLRFGWRTPGAPTAGPTLPPDEG